MTFPQTSVDDGRSTSSGTIATTTPTVTLPANLQTGDLIVIAIRVMGGPNGPIGWPSTGPTWTELVEDFSDPSNDTVAVGYRYLDGTEGWTGEETITLSSLSAKYAAYAWRITGAANPASLPPEYALATGGIANSVNPPELTPTGGGGGAKDYLWLGIYTYDGVAFPTGPPADYLNVVNTPTSGGGAASNGYVCVVERSLNAASENPGAWGLGANTNAGWTGITIAIHPAPSAVDYPRTAAIAGAATVAGIRKLARGRAAGIAGAATIAGLATITKLRSAAISGTATVAATRKLEAKRSSTISGAATVIAARHWATQRAAAIAGTGTVSGFAQVTKLRSASILGVGAFATERTLQRRRPALVAGAASISAARVLARRRVAVIDGIGVVAAVGHYGFNRAAAIAGVGTWVVKYQGSARMHLTALERAGPRYLHEAELATRFSGSARAKTRYFGWFGTRRA